MNEFTSLACLMIDGNSLYSFAALKENDLWPVANLHLGKFKSELRLVLLLRTEERLTNLLQSQIGWRLVV